MSREWDLEYQGIILKVPDGLGIMKGAVSKDIMATG